MPVLERDPWRFQYFEHVPCPDDVVIPADDPDCWLLYPEHRWIYDKLRIAETQGLACGPHGAAPASFPVFSKPIINLKGMGLGSRVIASASEMDHASQPGHMWMPLLQGPHVSTDCAVVNGSIAWIRHATGIAWTDGMFRQWTIHADPDPSLEASLRHWVGTHMRGYDGMMNFETIGGKIIEAHLRFADQWCDLNGKGWIEAMVRLYADGVWDYDEQRRVGYSVPLFARHNSNFSHPPQDLQTRIRAMPQVSSLQITFYDKKDAGLHPMPPGGFRLGIVNAWDLQAGFTAVDELAKAFPTHSLLRA